MTTRVQGTGNGSGYLAIAYAGEVRLYRADDSGSLNFTLLASASAPIGVSPMRLRLESHGDDHRSISTAFSSSSSMTLSTPTVNQVSPLQFSVDRAVKILIIHRWSHSVRR